MTIPLPGGWADELIWHRSNCPACRAPGNRCARGAQLVRLTLEERHGKVEK